MARTTISATPDGEAEFYSVREFANKARRGLNQVYAAIRTKEVLASRVGGSWRIHRSELERLARAEPPTLSPGRTELEDDTRFYILAGRLHALGPRVVAEFLLELARERMLRTVIANKLRDWTERLDLEMLKRVGADQPPPPVIHAVAINDETKRGRSDAATVT